MITPDRSCACAKANPAANAAPREWPPRMRRRDAPSGPRARCTRAHVSAFASSENAIRHGNRTRATGTPVSAMRRSRGTYALGSTPPPGRKTSAGSAGATLVGINTVISPVSDTVSAGVVCRSSAATPCDWAFHTSHTMNSVAAVSQMRRIQKCSPCFFIVLPRLSSASRPHAGASGCGNVRVPSGN